jgi:hypothetical protein
VSDPVAQPAFDPRPAQHSGRRVVMVASAGPEPTLADVAINLATVCAEIGQRVVLVSTAGLASPGDDSELPQSTPLWWKEWPSPGNVAGLPTRAERGSLLTGPVSPDDVEDLLGDTGVPGVSRLDLRHFVGHPVQVVVRFPEVLAALRQIVDVVILEVPSYLSVHYGEGLTPLADVVLVVGERETTTLDQMRRTSAALRHLEAPVVGMALTRGRSESYDWGLVDAELEWADELGTADEERNPTKQMPISESAGVAPAPPLDGLSVVEHSPRRA